MEHVSQELHHSLLHNDIQDILTGGTEFALMLQGLEFFLYGYCKLFQGLSAVSDERGFAAIETFLRDCFFASFFSQKQPPLLVIFFQYLVDFHNCISLAKTLRWQIDAEPEVIAGGTIPTDRFKRAYFRKDLSPVLTFLPLKNPQEAASGLGKLENALLSFITGKLKSWSLQRTVVADILYYLWEQYRYTRNISMVLNTLQLDDEPVRGSIVA